MPPTPRTRTNPWREAASMQLPAAIQRRRALSERAKDRHMNHRWLPIAAIVVVSTAFSARAQSYRNPVNYCRAVGTIDKPDARYVGPKLPGWMAKQLNLTVDQAGRMEWRCANGAVLACLYGANIPCGAKAGTNSTPTPAITDYCHENRDADFIPAVVTGHETNISWACRKGQPYISGSDELDAQGYVKRYWHTITP
jgi:hypothetical protein